MRWLRALLAAAGRHDVWVLTGRQRADPPASPGRAFPGLAHLPWRLSQSIRRGGFGRTRFHAHYDPWQRAASTQAIKLDRQVHFDLVHHSAHFTGSLAWLGIADSPAFLGEPETNGCAERWIRTLKDQRLWTTLHDTTDELRQAVASFVHRYNSSWLIQRHGHQTPKEA